MSPVISIRATMMEEPTMPREYVISVDGTYRLAGTRVSLDSIVYPFLRGDSPEDIAQSFPAVNLEQVYGAIAFYLGHRDEIDAYLAAGRADFIRLREQARKHNPALYRRLDALRDTITTRSE